MTRVGVICDTHVGEYLDALPPELGEIFADCALILHAGDICREWVLDELRAIAPVVAVLGDHDRLGGLDLPAHTTVDIDGVRIGLIHGRRRYGLEVAVTLTTVLTFGRLRWNARLHRSLLRRTGPVDVLIHGHWHMPVHRLVGRTLVFSPGAVCPWGSLSGGRRPGQGFTGVADRVVRRFRQLQGADAMLPAVGIIEIADGQARARRIRLPER